MRGTPDWRVKRVALGALAFVAAITAIVTFPRWGSESGSLDPPITTTAAPRPVGTSGSLSPDALNTELPMAPPIDTARVLNDPCVVLTPRLLEAVGVEAEPDRDGKWGCEAKAGKRKVEVDLQVPESNDPAETSYAYEKAHDEKPRPMTPPWFVFKFRDGDVTIVTLFCADVVVSLALPVEDVEEQLVRDLVADLG